MRRPTFGLNEIVLLPEMFLPHTYSIVTSFLKHIGVALPPYSRYSSNQASSDFWPFQKGLPFAKGRHITGAKRECLMIQLNFDNAVWMWKFIKYYISGTLDSLLEPIQTLLRT
ncbi:hypothetical protein MAR_018775 [Mya arenaria]|uniref:Maturase K n=1 Tax=Mya arenaria TaxID=6604 RepID=A0ABY7EIS2_MYAAR|nr:hypothetical protein MAR_018775 [Mya arenaria]